MLAVSSFNLGPSRFDDKPQADFRHQVPTQGVHEHLSLFPSCGAERELRGRIILPARFVRVHLQLSFECIPGVEIVEKGPRAEFRHISARAGLQMYRMDLFRRPDGAVYRHGDVQSLCQWDRTHEQVEARWGVVSWADQDGPYRYVHRLSGGSILREGEQGLVDNGMPGTDRCMVYVCVRGAGNCVIPDHP